MGHELMLSKFRVLPNLEEVRMEIRPGDRRCSPERGDPIDSMSPDRKWVPHCFADDTVEIWLRYCRDKLPIHCRRELPYLKLF